MEMKNWPKVVKSVITSGYYIVGGHCKCDFETINK